MLVHTSPSPATAQGARHTGLPLLCSKPALGLRQMPALPLLSLVPGVTAGFSPFLTQDWAGRSLQNKSVTTTGRARLEESWTTEMFVFEEGADLPTSFSPTLKTKAVLAASLPKKRGLLSQEKKIVLLLTACSRCRCKAAANREMWKPLSRGRKPQK